MIKSKQFWLAAILLAIVPLLIIDISQHVLDWRAEVREEIISVAQNSYAFSIQQKADILDRVFERNQSLIFYIYSKSSAAVVLLGLSVWLFRKYAKNKVFKPWKAVTMAACIIAAFLATKIFLVNDISRSPRIKYLSIGTGDSTLDRIYQDNFKGKVVYVDFWGTTCGPCLQEFRDFTQPLKNRYHSRYDMAWIYVSRGNRYLWKQQINKYGVEGYHVFVDGDQYDQLYRNLAGNKTETVLMPRYMVMDKKGKIVVRNAYRPSNSDSLCNLLDKYLAID